MEMRDNGYRCQDGKNSYNRRSVGCVNRVCEWRSDWGKFKQGRDEVGGAGKGKWKKTIVSVGEGGNPEVGETGVDRAEERAAQVQALHPTVKTRPGIDHFTDLVGVFDASESRGGTKIAGEPRCNSIACRLVWVFLDPRWKQCNHRGSRWDSQCSRDIDTSKVVHREQRLGLGTTVCHLVGSA